MNNIALSELMNAGGMNPRVKYLTETGVFTIAFSLLQRLKKQVQEHVCRDLLRFIRRILWIRNSVNSWRCVRWTSMWMIPRDSPNLSSRRQPTRGTRHLLSLPNMTLNRVIFDKCHCLSLLQGDGVYGPVNAATKKFGKF